MKSLVFTVFLLRNNHTKVEDNSTIINETNNTFYNPATGQTVPIVNWSYDYSDRSYKVTLESGDTATITYGDENITILYFFQVRPGAESRVLDALTRHLDIQPLHAVHFGVVAVVLYLRPAGQGGGRRQADARQGRQRGPAISGPLNVSHYFGVLL